MGAALRIQWVTLGADTALISVHPAYRKMGKSEPGSWEMRESALVWG